MLIWIDGRLSTRSGHSLCLKPDSRVSQSGRRNVHQRGDNYAQAQREPRLRIRSAPERIVGSLTRLVSVRLTFATPCTDTARTLTCQCLRNTLTQSVRGRTVSMYGEGSFNPSAPARLDLHPLAIPRHPLACAMPIHSRSSTWRTSLMTLAHCCARA